MLYLAVQTWTLRALTSHPSGLRPAAVVALPVAVDIRGAPGVDVERGATIIDALDPLRAVRSVGAPGG